MMKFLSFIPDFALMLALIVVLIVIAFGIYILKGIGAFLDAAIWLFEQPHRLMIAALIIIAAAGWWTAHGNNQRAVSWERASAAEATAHLESKAHTQAAAISAQLLAEQNRAAVEAKWRDQYQDAVDELQNLRGRNAGLVTEWLRQPRPTAIAADPRGTSGTDLPGLAEMPGGPLHDADTAIIPVADLYLSAEAFAQLEALIGWIETAQTVATSPTEPST